MDFHTAHPANKPSPSHIHPIVPLISWSGMMAMERRRGFCSTGLKTPIHKLLVLFPFFCGGISEGLEGVNVPITSERSATSKSFAKVGSTSWPDLLIAWLAKREKHRGLRGIPSRI